MPMSNYIRGLREKIGRDLIVHPSVAVAIPDRHGRILFGKHVEGNMWVLPGGLVEPEETPADAAVRETWEETGLFVELTGLIGAFGGPDFVVTYSNGDRVSYVNLLFRSRVISGEPKPDGEEIVEVRYLTRPEVKNSRHAPWLDGIFSALFSSDHQPFFQPSSWRP